MITTVLLGIGSGYFLWGSRVARLTESLNGLTLELDTMRAKMAAPHAAQAEEGGTKASEELHVINESIAAVRQELADQKVLIERQASTAPAPDAASASAELRGARADLAACIADKQDIELRCPAGTAPSRAPSYAPPAQGYRPSGAAPSPAPAARPPGSDLSDPRF
jgi:hypothetical protein